MASRGIINPSTVTDEYWVYAAPPRSTDSLLTRPTTHGKWLVFKCTFRGILDETWHCIRQAVESGELGSHCTGAKCSTAREKPESIGGADGVICVYTTKEGMDEVGLKLVQLVKQDLKYKTDEATLQGLYARTTHKKTTCRMLYWNEGDPFFK